MKKLAQLAILLLAVAAPLAAQKLDKQIEEIIVEAYPEDGPGGTFLIAKEGDIIFEKAFGKANLEWNFKNTLQSRYEIGSVTKQFTAAGILLLQEEGKLNVQDQITKYLPDYPTHNHEITIHHLLTHTSGIANYTDLPKWANHWREDFTPKELVDFFKDEDMNFAPGTQFSYSNSGYVLLGFIIEKVAEKSYAEFMDERFFTPLKMESSCMTENSAIIPHRTQGYSPTADGFQNKELLGKGQAYAAGAIISTASDLNLWGQALLNGTLLSASSWQQMTTNYTLENGEKINYGYGLAINLVGDKKTVEHGGGIFGYTSNLILIPEAKMCVVGLTNRDGKSPANTTYKMAKLALMGNLDNPTAIAMSEANMQEFVGVYEFENGTTRTITFEDGNLFSQRTGGPKYQIYPYQTDKFFFKGNETRLTFLRNNMNAVGAVKSVHRINEEVAQKTERKPVVKKVIEVEAAALKKLEGKYELAPEFYISVRAEGNKLFAQATMQEELEVFALSNTRFFYKVVDAEIEFDCNENGEATALTLFQGGREMKGKKVE